MSSLVSVSTTTRGDLRKPQRVRGRAPDKDMVWIPGGSFMMGSNDHYPEESPAHPVTVDGFWMDQFTVTNAQFSRFVEETGYVTSARSRYCSKRD